MATERERCTAKSKRSQQRCRRYPAAGGKVCNLHGGKSPQARRKAEERHVEGQLMAAAATMTTVRVDNPLEALQDFAGEVVAWKNLIAGRLADLDAIRYESPAGEQLRAEVALFERAMDRVTTVLAAIARLGIDDRLARITQAQSERLDLLIAAVFIDLGLTDDQQREGRQHLARRIRGAS